MDGTCAQNCVMYQAELWAKYESAIRREALYLLSRLPLESVEIDNLIQGVAIGLLTAIDLILNEGFEHISYNEFVWHLCMNG